MKRSCAESQKDGSYTYRHLIPVFYNVLQTLQVPLARLFKTKISPPIHVLQVTVAYALQLSGEEGVDVCTALTDAAAPVMAWACDVSSLAHAPAVTACFSAFASFSRRQCLDTDLINLFSSLKRFGEGAGSGELLPVCKEIAEQLTSDDISASTTLFPDQEPVVDDAVDSAAAAPNELPPPNELMLDGEIPVSAGNGDDFDGVGSPLAATPPAELHGASPLVFGDADETAPMSLFSSAYPQHAVRPLPLLQQSSSFVQNYDSLDFDDMNYRSSTPPSDHVNVDSVFAEVVSGLHSSTAQAVKRAQQRHKARRAGRNEHDLSLESFEGENGEALPQTAASVKVLDRATVEDNVAGQTIVDRLANIESMLSRFICANGSVDAFAPSAASVRSAVEVFLRQDEHANPLLSARSHLSAAAGDPAFSAERSAAAISPSQSLYSQHSAIVSPLLSARSQQSIVAGLPHDESSVYSSVQKQKVGRGNVTAAEAAAKYLKSSKNDSASLLDSSLPAIDTATRNAPNVSNSERNSMSLDPRRQSANLPVNRDSVQKALRAMTGECDFFNHSLAFI
jgi:hypothetical protein